MNIDFENDDFKKASFCGNCPHCVVVAHKEDVIAVRDTKDPSNTTLSFTKDEWQAFIAGVKNGEFDF